jgi:hypothetical protein
MKDLTPMLVLCLFWVGCDNERPDPDAFVLFSGVGWDVIMKDLTPMLMMKDLTPMLMTPMLKYGSLGN